MHESQEGIIVAKLTSIISRGAYTAHLFHERIKTSDYESNLWNISNIFHLNVTVITDNVLSKINVTVMEVVALYVETPAAMVAMSNSSVCASFSFLYYLCSVHLKRNVTQKVFHLA